MLLDGCDDVLDELAVLVLAHAVLEARVVDAVREQLPVTSEAGLDDLGMMVADSDVERNASAHAVPIHDVHQAPQTDTIAVVPVRIELNVRSRTRHVLARRVDRRKK